MRANVIESLVQENHLLQNQVNQLKYYLAGSHGLKLYVPDIECGQSIHCAKDDIHHIAAGLLAPSVTCLDIGAGLRPQRMLDCPVHLLLEPWRPYAERLLSTYPGKIVLNEAAAPYLSAQLDHSVDTIFMLDLIEHLEKEDGQALLREACRVARLQVVLFTPLGFMPHEVEDSPAEWGDVQHGATQKHRSGWTPQEIPRAVHVICEDYHTSRYGTFAAFYSIIPAQSVRKARLLLISELPPNAFEFSPNDLLVVDVRFCELSHLINAVPKRNTLVVPLELMAEQAGVPFEMLRRTLVNLPTLIHHLGQFEDVQAFGSAATSVLQRVRQHLEGGA